MTQILYLVILITLLFVIFSKKIHQFNIQLYSIAILIVVFTTKESPNIVNLGYVSIAFFIVTLYSGLLEKGKLRKKLFKVRAELAILGSIFLFPHAFGYFEFYIEKYGVFNLSISFYIGLLAYVIMIPLTITSIQKVRRKMKYKTWKKLHRTAYMFFLFVGLHVILIQNENMVMYLLLFGFYFTMKTTIIVQETYMNHLPHKTKVVGS